ncbi:MAG: hypothetical protein J7513_08370, partial [Solirubrobacteraceae bacterium]|nr:hypothetical protein [Solirubrobacteraceae bacterium]
MTQLTLPGGTFAMADDAVVTRVGYGAMQLAGPGVFGRMADEAAGADVLREVVAAQAVLGEGERRPGAQAVFGEPICVPDLWARIGLD